MNTSSEDNIYPVEKYIKATVNPTQSLLIQNYYQRIYYCSIVDYPNHKHLVYFEHELIVPGSDKNKIS